VKIKIKNGKYWSREAINPAVTIIDYLTRKYDGFIKFKKNQGSGRMDD